ncbi:MAG TPA: proton-conducting transporter membrane subunit [Gemmatimonadaceae bacterium]|nr:proton-conducting transporter membrane subunit [Gemmatimonadaceae bacterium]
MMVETAVASSAAGAALDGIAVWPVVIPLGAAAITALLRHRPALQRGVMEAAVSLMLAASIWLLAYVAHGRVAGMAFAGWGAPFGVTFVVDRVGAALTTVTGLVAIAVTIYARAEIRARRRRAGFDPIFLAMLASVNGAFLTGDIFNLYVWFELMLVAAMALVTIDRRPAQVDGAIRYAALSMLGATFILIGVGLLYGETGTLDMASISAALVGREPSVTLSAAAYLLFAGFALKAGLFPFLFWLPASYHTAPITASAALAGLLTKVGFYACLRVFVLVFHVVGEPAVPGLPALFTIVAVATMVLCVLAAIAQVDIRRLLAFHIIGQVAYMMLGLALLSLLGIAAAIFYMWHSMLVQAGLFLGAGAVGRATGGYDLRRAGGLMRERPLIAALFATLALSLSGVPPLSGFWAKYLVIDAAFRDGAIWLGVIALVVGLLTLYSMSKVWTDAFWRSPPRARKLAHRVPPAMVGALALLAACTMGIGIAVGPVSSFARAAAVQMLPPAATGDRSGTGAAVPLSSPVNSGVPSSPAVAGPGAP